jgi:isopenicillin N synthase-like dioxygenase
MGTISIVAITIAVTVSLAAIVYVVYAALRALLDLRKHLESLCAAVQKETEAVIDSGQNMGKLVMFSQDLRKLVEMQAEQLKATQETIKLLHNSLFSEDSKGYIPYSEEAANKAADLFEEMASDPEIQRKKNRDVWKNLRYSE